MSILDQLNTVCVTMLTVFPLCAFYVSCYLWILLHSSNVVVDETVFNFIGNRPSSMSLASAVRDGVTVLGAEHVDYGKSETYCCLL